MNSEDLDCDGDGSLGRATGDLVEPILKFTSLTFGFMRLGGRSWREIARTGTGWVWSVSMSRAGERYGVADVLWEAPYDQVFGTMVESLGQEIGERACCWDALLLKAVGGALKEGSPALVRERLLEVRGVVDRWLAQLSQEGGQ